MSIKLNDVFISYRREGGSELAQLVYKDLKKRGYRVFMDVRELRSGHFDSELRRQVSASKDFILLLTPGSLDRCDDPNDWLFKEIEMALSLGLNIVPLVKTPFRIPDPADLPAELSELPRHNAIDYNHDKSDESLSLIVSRLGSKASWLQANQRRVTGISLVVASIAVAMGVWIGFGKLERKADLTQDDTSEIKENTSTLIESTEAIQNDSKVIKEEILSQGKKTGEQIDSIGFKIDALARSIQEGIGAANLGSDYDMVNAHRDFQDRYIEKGGSVDPLIDEYIRKTINHPENAMYYYLLSRLHNTYAANPSEARIAAEKGYKADKDFFWNARSLLYFTFSQELDIASLLDLEAEYYKITKEEKSMFASGEHAQIMSAFEGIKARFKGDPIRHHDLSENKLCWHLFRALSEKPYSDLHGFRNLVGKEAVSSRNLVKLKVLDVKTGFDAIGHLWDGLGSQGGGGVFATGERSSTWPNFRSNSVYYEKDGDALRGRIAPPRLFAQYAMGAPPVAVRLSMEIATFDADAFGNKFEFLNLLHMSDRKFNLLAHVNSPKSMDLVRYNHYPCDTEWIQNGAIPPSSDFWVVIPGAHDPWASSPWASSKGSALTFDFTMRYKGDPLHDLLFISNEGGLNLRKGNTEALVGMELHRNITRVQNTRLHSTGHRVDKPIEGRISRNLANSGYMDLNIYGLPSRPIRLMYGISPTKKTIDLRSSGLPDNVSKISAAISPKITEFLSKRSNGEWIRFTGLQVHKSASLENWDPNATGIIFMVPDSAALWAGPSSNWWLQQAQEPLVSDRVNLLHESRSPEQPKGLPHIGFGVAGTVAKWQGPRHITGIELAEVLPDSPADVAGMQRGDVVVNFKWVPEHKPHLALGGKPEPLPATRVFQRESKARALGAGGGAVGSLKILKILLSLHEPGDKVELTFFREAAMHKRKVTLGPVEESLRKTEAQKATRWKSQFFKMNPNADNNKDGTLSWPELNDYRRSLGWPGYDAGDPRPPRSSRPAPFPWEAGEKPTPPNQTGEPSADSAKPSVAEPPSG